MNHKPVKILVNTDDEKEITDANNLDKAIKPFRYETNENIDVSDDLYDNNEFDNTNKCKLFLQNTAKFMNSLGGIISALFILVLCAVLADTINTLHTIISGNIISGSIYLFGLLLFLSVLSYNLYSWYKQIIMLRDAEAVRAKFIAQKEEPNKELIPLAYSLVQYYEKSLDPDIKKIAQTIGNELNSSHVYQDIYDNINILLLGAVDKKIKKIIHTAGLQVALTTAVSSIAIIDILLVIWKSLHLTKEISALYGFKPGTISTIILLKKGIINIAFAGVIELSTNFNSDYLADIISSQVAKSSMQGFANGILLARLGYGIMAACRPIKSCEQQENFAETFVKTLINTIKPNTKKTNN
ncbi:MAG: DUF697 domain-containing protein [Mariprofundales bacterium]